MPTDENVPAAAEAEPLDVLNAAAQALLRHVPADVWCAVMLDPATLLDTGGLHEHGFPGEVMPRLFEIEHGEQIGVDNIRALARRPTSSSLLSVSTRGELTQSVYFQDILSPAGLADELRVALRADGHTWGLLVLCRANGSAPFTARDVERAEAISSPAATDLRRALLLKGIDDTEVPDAPGLVMARPDGRITYVSRIAEFWLSQISERHRDPSASTTHTLTAVLSRARRGLSGQPVSARVRLGTGRWLTISAWRDAPAGEEAIIASLTPSRPASLAALVLNGYGLSPRERQIAQLVILGRTYAEIATSLHIQEQTVNDHMRKVFAKTGVGNRVELCTEMFTRHHLPVIANPPLSTDGRLMATGA
ncbi:LuxR C-terminal-related transcriptional regulator [Streptomyces sp. NPDC001307]|uniref:LuxR C-terminal-related transcriptional regulator n=1 Tax=Streptomyces sp. NPDC001307 TaxID=3364560 RepID=UPI003696502A